MLQNLSAASHSMRCLSEELHSVESRIHQVCEGPGERGGSILRLSGPLFLKGNSVA